MDPPKYFGLKVDEDPQDFLDEVYKIFFAMGVSTMEKSKLAAYQLKDVVHTWYNLWKDSRVLGDGPMIWEIFEKAFLDRFFPREQRKAKVEEFINLCQGGMCVKEYSLKFIKLSKYASTLVSKAMEAMSHYVTSVSEELEEECRATMIHDNMNLSRLMVHAQQVEKSRLRKRNREVKKAKSFESGSSKSKLDVQDKPKFKKRF
ncbi:uncharacterized protein [Solanum lycopersicum]|uniref:uncharacterized protein n=1 Tax=Solanum lycopersicum TaxID=4081 RepID=UPI0037487253